MSFLSQSLCNTSSEIGPIIDYAANARVHFRKVLTALCAKCSQKIEFNNNNSLSRMNKALSYRYNKGKIAMNTN